MHAETMTITVYLTRAGIKDKGGVEQPAYLNFEATLNRAPNHDLRVRSLQRPSNLDRRTAKLFTAHLTLSSLPGNTQNASGSLQIILILSWLSRMVHLHCMHNMHPIATLLLLQQPDELLQGQ